MYFSIDDIKDRFEYQRTGASWATVLDTLAYFYKMSTTNHLFHFNITWSYLNIYYLPELIDWIKETLPTNRFGDDTKIHLQQAVGTCAIKTLTQDQYNALAKKFNGYAELDYILATIKISLNKPTRVFNYLEKLDKVRNLAYNHAHSEWEELLIDDKYYQLRE